MTSARADTPDKTRSPRRSLLRDERGGVSTEYLVITCLCLGLATVLAGLALGLHTANRRATEILGSDTP